jgi:hypothetical protein
VSEAKQRRNGGVDRGHATLRMNPRHSIACSYIQYASMYLYVCLAAIAWRLPSVLPPTRVELCDAVLRPIG